MSRTPLVTFLSKVRSIDSNRVFFSMGSLFKWSFTRRRPVWIVTGNCRLAIRSKIEDSHQLYICNNFLIIYYMKGIPFLPVCKSQNYIVILLSRYLFRLYFEHMSSKMFCWMFITVIWCDFPCHWMLKPYIFYFLVVRTRWTLMHVLSYTKFCVTIVFPFSSMYTLYRNNLREM